MGLDTEGRSCCRLELAYMHLFFSVDVPYCTLLPLHAHSHLLFKLWLSIFNNVFNSIYIGQWLWRNCHTGISSIINQRLVQGCTELTFSLLTLWKGVIAMTGPSMVIGCTTMVPLMAMSHSGRAPAINIPVWGAVGAMVSGAREHTPSNLVTLHTSTTTAT